MLSLLLILAALVVISQVQRRRDAQFATTTPIQEKVAVTLTGAFSKPGTYWVQSGTTLGDVLKKGRPKRFADLRTYDLTCLIEAPLEVIVEELEEIVVYVEGAIEAPLELHLPTGTRLSDLKSKVSCLPEADITFFKGRRYLLDGERIIVPEKVVKKEVE